MSLTLKNQLLEDNEDAIVSALILFILDQLDQAENTSGPHRSLREVFQRYPLHVVIEEMRNVLTALYIPQAADLTHLAMQYHGVLLVPQQEVNSYYTTFLYGEALYSTSMATTPFQSLELAQHMVDQLRHGVELRSSIVEKRADASNSSEEKVSILPTSPPKPIAQDTSPFIRIGRIALSTDKILYVKDDSTEHYHSVRVGLAGGVDMRLDANPAHNYIHTQEVRFIGEEARAFLVWHQRWTFDLPHLEGADRTT
ncbi:MAG: hypothetical protein H0U76_03155 [Ktedonobacteraceae bacterium]|nr:hypothetical protein [Ktedonobacteraceae bacterium]